MPKKVSVPAGTWPVVHSTKPHHKEPLILCFLPLLCDAPAASRDKKFTTKITLWLALLSLFFYYHPNLRVTMLWFCPCSSYYSSLSLVLIKELFWSLTCTSGTSYLVVTRKECRGFTQWTNSYVSTGLDFLFAPTSISTFFSWEIFFWFFTSPFKIRGEVNKYKPRPFLAKRK